jgi:hypothetical protein
VGGSNALKGLTYLFLQTYVNKILAGANIIVTPNAGTGTVTIAATTGAGGVAEIIAGANISISPISGVGNVTISLDGELPSGFAAVAHEWIDSYDAATGLFSATQPAFTDISGVATTAQIGTGTPSAGDYVDGGTGAWTALPAIPTFVDNETVAGSGTTWTLANVPDGVPILMVPPFPGYGLLGMILDSAGPYGYTISGANITTVTSFPAGSILAWYRH